ncbi:hypothetical protein [Hoeflea alexandrii]|uniref:hypothetical protein n=1 Tax=Hoeflea alexandrii TaxID=288436 RepID=UPI0022AEC16F|nr:hypothetical protein [Hoeflea alexandrii]MCZ4287381.1 hypothetical protein [Hoeflea alexandrii]
MKPKNYLITQSLDEIKDERRVFPRRDANCPVIARVRQRGREEEISVPCWMVNLCEDGCLLTSDYFPRRIDDVRLTIPGIIDQVRGKARSQGKFTINVKFSKLLKVDIVEMVGRIKTIPKP